MKSAKLYCSIAATLLLAAPAVAQSDPMAQAVANTIARGAEARGADQSQIDATVQAASDYLKEVASGFTAGFKTYSSTPSWMAVIKGLGLPWPLSLSQEPGCTEYEVAFDSSGNLIVPAIPLAGNGARFEPYVYSPTGNNHYDDKFAWRMNDLDGTPMATATEEASALYFFHSRSVGKTDSRDWFGVYAIEPFPTNQHAQDYKLYKAATTAYRNPDGTTVARKTVDFQSAHEQYYSTNYSTNKPCPLEGGGGSFHYYSHGPQRYEQSGCIMYAPNYSLSPTGYAYAPSVSLSNWESVAWPRSAPEQINLCPLSAETLRQIANGLAAGAAAKTGYAGFPHETLTADDVRIGDSDPAISDLGGYPKDGLSLATSTSTPPTPPSDPTGGGDTGGGDTGGSGGSLDLGTAPDHSAPTDADLAVDEEGWLDPLFDMFTAPDWSAFDWAYQGGALGCPVWSWNMWEQNFTLDHHCPIAEAHAETIGMFMITLFTMGAFIIMLKA